MDIEKNEKIKFTNLDKIYFPKTKITKGDVLEYYGLISKYILPHIKDRPLTLKRYPDGINGPVIYQRHLTSRPDLKFLDTAKIYVKEDRVSKQFILCPGKPGLLHLAQLGTIEFHPWHSKIDKLENPAYMVFDLDPPKGDFQASVKVALVLKKILDRLKLASFVKTSGKSGIHIFVPVQRKFNYEQIRGFARNLGLELQKKKSNVTMEQRKGKRGNAVYFDCNQNAFSKSMVSVYSLRATPEATVSFPVEWSRLGKIRPTDFTIKNVPALLKKGDRWAPLLGKTRNSIIL